MWTKSNGVGARDVMKNTRLDAGGKGETEPAADEDLQSARAIQDDETLKTNELMNQLCGDESLDRACKRVMANRGSPGIDGMPTEALSGWLNAHREELKRQLRSGEYKPTPVRKVEIPKHGGGVRQLGIPTVKDRMVQQALAQVLTPEFDKGFSESSYGFRPGRSAHDALKRAREYVQEGREYVVDIDLEKFFDRVNHDKLMARVKRKVTDKRILWLIGCFLRSGIMDEGVCEVRTEGTPQGGPLSPLLSNIMLDDLDKELERRGHIFCRYADDCNVYVGSLKAGERVMVTLVEFLEKKLKLRVNREKSKEGPSRHTKVPGVPDFVEWLPCDSENEC